jgi:hypothetical protein
VRIRYRGFVVCVAVAAVMLVPGLSLAGGQDTEKTWTIALYIDADNDFDTYWEGQSLPWLQNIPAAEHLHILAYVDRMSVEGTEIVEISGGTVTRLYSTGEKNFGDGATFSWFLVNASSIYQTDHLAVIAWDHGNAWTGFCRDDSSDGDKITLQEMQDAIVAAGVRIDILSFDACALGSIEAVYQASLTGLVKYFVASEELVPGTGFPYDLMFTPLANDPARCPRQVSCDMVKGWAEYYDPLSWAWYATMGAIDVDAITASMPSIMSWCKAMADGLPDYYWDYRIALRDSYYVSNSQYQTDMVDIGNHLLADPDVTDPALIDATKAMIGAVDGALVKLDNTDRSSACGGISIYWGVRNTWVYSSEAYATISFAKDSGWSTFLESYNG